MRIPGLTFIIVPILSWLVYINYNIIIDIISKFYQETGVVGIIFVALFCLLLYSQFFIPFEYTSNYEYDKKYYKDLKYKTYYLSKHCFKKPAKWIRFSLIYWIVIIIIEINIFCNKYFTFKL